VNQWRHCNGYLPTSGYISPSKTTFPTAAAAPLKAIATVILIDIIRVLSNHNSTVNPRAIAMVKQRHRWKPLQWLF